ncbi:helix-turn-helix domain-containing protein, partial [Saccharolobus solfataricus]|uniref:helix-turn-helix domain-containing protein n=1 Tax=Saccharolobus solfataricus TaxID=2287 RepID=UPI000496C4F1
ILAVKLHLVDGKSEKEVSKMLNKGYSTIKLWVGKYKKEGLNGLRDKPRSGRPRKAEKGKIKQILEDQPQKYGIQEEYWTMRTFKIA